VAQTDIDVHHVADMNRIQPCDSAAINDVLMRMQLPLVEGVKDNVAPLQRDGTVVNPMERTVGKVTLSKIID